MTGGTGYRLAVPAAWDRIDLDSPRRAADVAALVDRRSAGVDDQPLARVRCRELLAAEVERAHALGGLELHVWTRAVAGVVLPASLLVHVLPARCGPEELVVRLGAGAQVCELPVGPAVRRARQRVLPGDGGDLPVTSVEHVFPVPGSPDVNLVLSGHTASGPLAAPLVELFDTVAATLRWVGAEEVAA